MRINYSEMPNWPPLAWLAEVDSVVGDIQIWHGSRVECGDYGFCEALWDGPFDQAGFDQTDIVFGSGGRLRDQRMTFVSAGSTVDRLQFLRREGGVCVSNSLACLAEFAELEFAVDYPHYYRDFRSIEDGLHRVASSIATDKGQVELVYFQNLIWDGCELLLQHKPNASRSFEQFTDYEGFLQDAIKSLGDNMRDGARAHPFEPLGTLSTGYDSTTVAVLAKQIGCHQVVSFREARGGQDDFGGAIARKLELEILSASREAWRQLPLAEVPFLAANAYGEEAHYGSIAALLSGKVLFTGFHGDKVWDKPLLDDSNNIVRGDPTGLGLTEFRLWAGFIHCPVPFMGSRNIASINALSNASEQLPWDVPGNYSRPICRRIVETAGIDRKLFGMEKKAASVVMRDRQDSFLTPESLESYHAWLSRYKAVWLSRGQLPPQWRLDPFASPLFTALANRLIHLSSELPGLWRVGKLLGGLKVRKQFLYLFPWAVSEARKRYRRDQIACCKQPD